MSGIHVLDYNMVNKIAAGEVVERPCSVVKELVENSIDAGAKSITVEIKDGGISLIRITDNGSGIAKEDIKQAFLRHATSKISDIDDLETLMTMGFRGEALSSISSVSQVEMVTKTSSDITGTRIEIHGGQMISEQEIGCADGTTFIMRNLFFNTPARRKFLKKPAVESGYISDIINKLALGHPDIAFKYINNDSTLIQTNGNGDLKTAIFNIYGKDVAQKLLAVDYDDGEYHLQGYIGKPELSRANRTYENFFINGRFIKSSLINSAVEEAFGTRIMTGKFPLFVLNLNIAPSNVDVNVHPSKLEVRFSNEDGIYNFVLKAVEPALKSEALIPTISMNNKEDKKTFADITNNKPYKPEERQAEIFTIGKSGFSGGISALDINSTPVPPCLDISLKEDAVAYKIITGKEEVISDGLSGNNLQKRLPHDASIDSALDNKTTDTINKEAEAIPFFNNYRIIGQIFNTYWLIEQDNDMYLIDQHAAHEKVLYEEFASKFRTEKITSQRLLSPAAVNLSEREYNIVKENTDLLNGFGYELEEFGGNTFALRSVPNIFNKPSNANFFMEIVDKLSSVDTSVDNIYDIKLDSIAAISCKAAIKANDRLGYLEAENLIEQILKLEDPFHCPHGRPTIVKITKYEIEKMFKRII